MATFTKKTLTKYIDLSRLELEATMTHYNDGSRIVENLNEITQVGCLQRIASSMECISASLVNIEQKLPDDNSEKYKKQVAKLSARLKKAGLDGNPNSDRRKMS